jgi:hypothetical protein
MIAIVNVSPDAPVTGINQYEVRINRRVIAKFEHFRHLDGLAQCLRDAADAVDRSVCAEQLEVLADERRRDRCSWCDGTGKISDGYEDMNCPHCSPLADS